MKIGIDNATTEFDTLDVDLSEYKTKEEKYVHAVDNKIDIIVTSSKEVATYFRSNGIPALLELSCN